MANHTCNNILRTRMANRTAKLMMLIRNNKCEVNWPKKYLKMPNHSPASLLTKETERVTYRLVDDRSLQRVASGYCNAAEQKGQKLLDDVNNGIRQKFGWIKILSFPSTLISLFSTMELKSSPSTRHLRSDQRNHAVQNASKNVLPTETEQTPHQKCVCFWKNIPARWCCYGWYVWSIGIEIDT